MGPDRPARGSLRIYLGAAPGVGKTYAMLAEAHRRVARGADLVVAFVEPHGRVKTAAQVGEPGGRTTPHRPHRGAAFEEMDVDAVLARAPRWPWWTSSPTRTHPAPATRSAGRTWTAARRRHRRHHDGERAAPRVAQRRGRAHHRRPPAGDRARWGRAGGRADRAGRHDAGGAAPADGARQRVRPEKVDSALANYFRAGQPGGAARARPAVARRPGRHGPRGLPRATTASPNRGRPASGSSSRSPARRAART